MPFTRSVTVKILRISAVVVIVGIIVSYAVWRSLNYARGPEIRIDAPKDGSTIASSTIVTSGQALRITDLTLNGQTIPVDQSGAFRQIIVIFPGINRLELSAHDQFGRTVTKDLTLYGDTTFPKASTPASGNVSSMSAASSSASSTSE